MKNELIFHFLNIELPSKKPLYILFTDVKWEDFTSQKGIDCRDLENWVNIAMASSARSRWITERIRPLNKMNEAKDYPNAVKSLWDKFVTMKENAPTNDEVRCFFEKNYKKLQMDRKSYTMSTYEVICWHGTDKAHMYF
jgi:hypothetical protein